MKSRTEFFDLKQSCRVYSESIKQTMHNLFAIELDVASDVEKINHLDDQEDIYFSIFFTGQVYGELLIGINRVTALRLLAIPVEPGQEAKSYWDNRTAVMETFKEIINIAAGQALRYLKEAYPQVTITPPRATEGRLSLADFEFNKVKFAHTSGDFSCYMYIDQMRLDVATALEVGEKTIEQQKHQQEELSRLNKAKTEFLANMSHELRTPLNGMIGMVDILKTTELNQVQLDQLGVVSRSGEFLLTIINEILDFSKIESGRLELETEDFDLINCIESVVETLAPEVFKKHLDFCVTISPEISTVFRGDKTRLKQVLMNLVGNAIKFTPTGLVEIIAEQKEKLIEIHVKDTGVGIPASKLSSIFDSFNQADVSDTRRYGGTGLGLTISKSIVEAMGGELLVSSTEAVGSDFTIRLPLKILNNCVKLQKPPNNNLRTIWYESVSEKLQNTIETYRNSTFLDLENTSDELVIIDLSKLLLLDKLTISERVQKFCDLKLIPVLLIRPNETQKYLTFCQEFQLQKYYFLKLPVRYSEIKLLLHNPQLLINENLNVKKSKPAISSAEKGSVLLVEDNPVNQLVAKTMLEKLGYSVTTALHGEEALSCYKEKRFELIFMDCQMPVMDGYKAANEIRKLEKLLHYSTPIIALTANALKETKEQCFEAGMSDFATKPIRIEDLKLVIERILSRTEIQTLN